MRARTFPCPLSRGLQPATTSNGPCQDNLLAYRKRSVTQQPAMATQVLPRIFSTWPISNVAQAASSPWSCHFLWCKAKRGVPPAPCSQHGTKISRSSRLAAARPHEKSFSADTGMGEVLVVARKRFVPAAEQTRTPTVFANLHQRPATTVEATEIARHFDRDHDVQSEIERITIGDQIVGTTYRADLRQGGCAGVRDLELARTAIALESNELQLPTLQQPSTLAMVRLSHLGQRGLYHLDIDGLNSDKSYRGPFDILPLSGQPSYPAMWSHDADRERQLILAPDCEGQIRPGMENKAHAVWATASRLHFNLDFRLNSQSLAAAVTGRRSIGGTAWPNFRLNDPAHEAALVLWSNTTLGLFCFWWSANRQQAGRARLTISQLPALLVIDTTQLSSKQLAEAERVFDKFAKQPLLPANEAFRDKVRIALDEEFLVQVLGLDPNILEPLEIFRNKWCAEPSVHGGKSTHI